MGFSTPHFRNLIFPLIILLVFSCDSNNGFVPTSAPPVAKIYMPKFFTTHTQEATVRAYLENVKTASKFVIDYGFLINNEPFEGFEADRKISLGNTFGDKEKFETKLSNLTEKVHFLRAYVEYEDDESYVSDLAVINTQPGKWVRKSPFPGKAKIRPASFVINGIAYIVGGKSDELWSYDPSTDHWEQKASCPKALDNPLSFVINGRAYVGCNLFGNQSDRLDDFWSYDPERDQWKTVASPSEFRGSHVKNAFAFSMGRFGYIECNYNQLLQYDPFANRWYFAKSKGYFQFDREDAVALSIGDQAIVVGGQNAVGEYLADVQIFSAKDSTWIEKATFPANKDIDTKNGRTGGIGFVLNNQYYAGMGEAPNRLSYPNLYHYDAEHDLWIANERIPALDYGDFGIQQGVGFSVNGKGYITLGRRNWRIGSEDFSETNKDLWEFNPE